MTVIETSHDVDVAAKTGSHLDLMVAMRNRLSEQVAEPDCPPRDLAALTRRLQDIAEKIDAIKTRMLQDEREQNPCTHCEGTGVSRDSASKAKAAGKSNDDWQPE